MKERSSLCIFHFLHQLPMKHDTPPVVLIVEDDEFLLKLMAISLAKHGVEIRQARDGAEAILLLGKEPVTLVLLDILMPQKSGFDVLEFMKEKKLSLPVLILTNLSDKETMVRCKEYGCSEYYVKSDMDEKQLYAHVEKYLV